MHWIFHGFQSAYRRAKAAVQMAMTQKRQVVKFDDCGLYRLLYMVEDTGVLQEIETGMSGRVGRI